MAAVSQPFRLADLCAGARGPVRARLAMTFWGLHQGTAGGTRDAFKTHRHGAAQPVGTVPSDHVAECVGIRVVSFNCGIQQTMLESGKQWNQKHVLKFRDLLQGLGPSSGSHFVFCSEVGDARKGVQEANVDVGHIVLDAMPGGADVSTSGAYLHVWNVQNKATTLVQQGTWSASPAHTTDMYWQAFDLDYRDATQLAGTSAPHKVGLLVGNMHIPVGRVNPPSMATRKRFVESALQHLTDVDVGAWQGRDNFTVVRILVGDCNMSKDLANACTQDRPSPRLTPLQNKFDLSNWEVCDVLFPRQALDSAWKQNRQNMFWVAFCLSGHVLYSNPFGKPAGPPQLECGCWMMDGG